MNIGFLTNLNMLLLNKSQTFHKIQTLRVLTVSANSRLLIRCIPQHL